MIEEMIIKFNKADIATRIKEKIGSRQEKLDAQILRDSNFFIPKLTSTLEKSGIIHSKIGQGRIIWRTPYARYQYYEDLDHSKQINPNATMRWFESAKARYLKDWEKIANGK